MATVLILPDKISAAYERIPVRISRDVGDPDPSISVTFNTSTGEKTVTLQRSAGPEGYVDFDLSGVLKRGFYDKQTAYNGYSFFDNLLFGDYTFMVGDTTYSGYSFIRQVQQFGFRKQLATETPSALTTIPGPFKRYEDYPLEVAIFNPLGDEQTLYFNAVIGSSGPMSMPLNRPLTVVILNRDPFMSTLTGFHLSPGGPTIYAEYYIENECTPEKPFYIRWINELGGWDYRMFGERKFIEDVVEDVENIQKSERGNEYDTQETIGLNAYQYVEVGADQLGAEEFDALRKLGRSPRIQYWNVDAQAWFTIVLRKENKIDSETDTPKAEVSYVFQMQRIRLQF